ncbi:MAG: AAA family ATPase [Bacteroidales bacterium]|nr:AAA family ATPase [Candidatus Physcousia equi]
MAKAKKIPYGMTNLESIIREGYYYVDKTHFIPKLEEDGRYVIFLRPRRYGKSITIAMLEYYYGLQYADRFEGIFSELYIGQHPTELRNSYLVLSLNFSAVDPDKDKVEESFNANLLLSLRSFARKYKAYLPEGAEALMQSQTHCCVAFNSLCDMVSDTPYKMYVMIDEYDNFANTLMSYDEGAYMNLTHGDGFFRLFFNSLKAVTTGAGAVVDRMYISGVSPLTLSDVTSGFNIGENLSLLADYNSMVGFTEQEVKEMLQYYYDTMGQFRHTVDELLEVMRPWYDNNCFSELCLDDEHMFNSDMVLYFINQYMRSRFTLPSEMIDTNVSSDYGKMRKMVRIEQNFGHNAQILQQITMQGYSSSPLKREFSISELHEPRILPSLMYYMGMLTHGLSPNGHPSLVVPNLVVREQYYKYLDDCYDRNMQWEMELWEYDQLGVRMARDGEGEPLLRFVAEQIRENSSTRDFDVKAESFVKGFMLAKLGGMVSYFISATEPDMNHGYADLYLEPWTERTSHAYIIKLKYLHAGATDAEVEAKRLEAIDQAHKYAQDKQLNQRAAAKGWTLHKFVIVFSGWQVRVVEKVSPAAL